MTKYTRYFYNSCILMVVLLTLLSAIGLFAFGYEICLYPFVVFGLLSLLLRPYWRKADEE